MSVKQDLQAIKDGFDLLSPEDRAFVNSLVPLLTEKGPRLMAILQNMPGIENRLLGLGMSAVTEAGRERLAKAAAEVFAKVERRDTIPAVIDVK